MLDRAVVAHTYALMPTAMIGVGLTAWVFAFGAIGDLSDRRLVVWMLSQSVVLAVNVAVLASYRRGRLAESPRRARFWHRTGVLLAGLAWGLAGHLWPLDVAMGPSFALLFCYAGMCAGGATTLAGDPVAYGIFATSALLPYFVQSFPEISWIGLLLAAFVAITSTTVVWNARTLRESLALRFENVDLLDEAIREREAAVAARAEAERAAHARTRFLAAASHDLRQPVQALSLFVDALQREPGRTSDAQTRAIDALGRTTDALRAMLEGLLDVSRLDSGMVVGTPTRIRLAPLLDEIVAALRDEAEAHDGIVHYGGRIGAVHADPMLLSRVLHNLVGNAVRHGGRGRVLVAIRRRGDRTEIQVWDQGPGIAAEDQARIFEEFVQLGNEERDRRKGLGLGLPIVKRICDQNGWSLTLRSRVGRGSVFTVVVPSASDEADRPDPVASTLERDALRVLLVEDDALVAEASAGFLRTLGYEVHLAGDADSALRTLDRLSRDARAPAILVTDLRLPGRVDGRALLREIRARLGDALPAIVLTGDPASVGDDRGDEGLLLRKPVSGETLDAAIRRLVAGD